MAGSSPTTATSPASGTTGSAKGGDDAVTDLENSPATPVQDGGDAPAADLSLSCYGSGGRQTDAAPSGVKAGPLVLASPRRRGNVVEAPAVVQPGAAVTVAASGRAGLLYGPAWRRPHRLSFAPRIVRFEGCSDTTEGGGAARFDGGLIAPGCAELRIWITGRDGFVRRRVACR